MKINIRPISRTNKEEEGAVEGIWGWGGGWDGGERSTFSRAAALPQMNPIHRADSPIRLSRKEKRHSEARDSSLAPFFSLVPHGSKNRKKNCAFKVNEKYCLSSYCHGTPSSVPLIFAPLPLFFPCFEGDVKFSALSFDLSLNCPERDRHHGHWMLPLIG